MRSLSFIFIMFRFHNIVCCCWATSSSFSCYFISSNRIIINMTIHLQLQTANLPLILYNPGRRHCLYLYIYIYMTNSYIYSSIMKESAPPNRWALLFFVVSLLWNHAVATDSELSQTNNGVSVSIVLCVAPPYIFIYIIS